MGRHYQRSATCKRGKPKFCEDFVDVESQRDKAYALLRDLINAYHAKMSELLEVSSSKRSRQDAINRFNLALARAEQEVK